MKIPVDRARVSIPNATTAEAMVTEGNSVVTGVEASVNIAAATDVATAAKALGTVTSALDANNQAKAKAKAALATAETNEAPLVRRWGTKRRALASAIEDFADGSKDVALTFNVKLEEKAPTPIAGTPVNLRAMKSRKPTWAGCRWDRTPGAHGYMLQHATNPADATTYSTAMAISSARFWLTGQTSGTTLYFRVLACDAAILPSGQTPYTGWVAVLVP
jgi:hypothetical protein